MRTTENIVEQFEIKLTITLFLLCFSHLEVGVPLSLVLSELHLIGEDNEFPVKTQRVLAEAVIATKVALERSVVFIVTKTNSHFFADVACKVILMQVQE
jgi:hypothetical protein